MSLPSLHAYYYFSSPVYLFFGAIFAWSLACVVLGWLIGTARPRPARYTELIMMPPDLRTGSPAQEPPSSPPE
jgi:hypothetical protein